MDCKLAASPKNSFATAAFNVANRSSNKVSSELNSKLARTPDRSAVSGVLVETLNTASHFPTSEAHLAVDRLILARLPEAIQAAQIPSRIVLPPRYAQAIYTGSGCSHRVSSRSLRKVARCGLCTRSLRFPFRRSSSGKPPPIFPYGTLLPVAWPADDELRHTGGSRSSFPQRTWRAAPPCARPVRLFSQPWRRQKGFQSISECRR